MSPETQQTSGRSRLENIGFYVASLAMAGISVLGIGAQLTGNYCATDIQTPWERAGAPGYDDYANYKGIGDRIEDGSLDIIQGGNCTAGEIANKVGNGLKISLAGGIATFAIGLRSREEQ